MELGGWGVVECGEVWLSGVEWCQHKFIVPCYNGWDVQRLHDYKLNWILYREHKLCIGHTELRGRQ